MRFLAVLFVGVLFGSLYAQTPAPNSLFLTVKPQATVVVKQDPLGPSVVEVTMLDAEYPADLLRAQCEQMGKNAGATASALQVFNSSLRGGDAKTFLKAVFGVPGLLDVRQKMVRLAPIVKAFAGAPRPYTITGLDIIFEGITLPAKTPTRFDSPTGAVSYEVQSGASMGGAEYRVELLTQDPAKIDIPEPGQAATPVAITPSSPVKGFDWTLTLLVLVAAIAVGALVYSVLIRPRPRPRAKS